MTLHQIADLLVNYRRFVERAVANKIVWVLLRANGRDAWVESNHFADEAYAKRLAVGEWADASPRQLPLEGYLEVLPRLPGLVMPNPNGDFAGVEVEPEDLFNALTAAMEGREPDFCYARQED